MLPSVTTLSTARPTRPTQQKLSVRESLLLSEGAADAHAQRVDQSCLKWQLCGQCGICCGMETSVDGSVAVALGRQQKKRHPAVLR